MRLLVSISLSFILVAVCALTVYAQPVNPGAPGTPGEVSICIDVEEVRPKLLGDIQELGKPQYHNAEIWIATWSWATEFLIDPDNKRRLIDEITDAMASNPALKLHILLWDMPAKMINSVFDIGWQPFNESELKKRVSKDVYARIFIRRESQLPSAGSAHQKFLLLQWGDDSAGYCFGFNFANNFWDWMDHDAANRERAGLPSPPLHDTAIRFKGEAIHDFKKEYLERWKKAKGAKAFPQALFPLSPFAQPVPYVKARFHKPGVKGGDIKDWYVSAITNAKEYIYLENQYFDYSPIGDALIAAYFRRLGWEQPNVTVNLCPLSVMSPKSQVDGTLREVMRVRLATATTIDLKDGKSIARSGQWKDVKVNGNASKCMLQDKSGRKYKFASGDIRRLDGGVRFYSMVTSDAAKKGFQPVYVHSKAGLIDNQLTIGSSNQNRRSYSTDYEANVMVTDTPQTNVVEDFRQRLLTLLIKRNASPGTILKQLEETAEDNSKLNPTSVIPEGKVIHYPFHK